MEIRRGKCSGCGKETYIQNKTLNLCSECVYKKNHGGRTRQQVQLDSKRKKIQKKSTGERELFLKIWLERPHYCINCGKWLGPEPKNFMFSHRVAKGVSEQQRLNPDNIDLLCFDCHFARDMQGEKCYEKRRR